MTVSDSFSLSIPFIANPPDGFNVIVVSICRELGAYFADVFHNSVAASCAFQPPDGFINAFPVKYLPCIQGQKLNNGEFRSGEYNRVFSDLKLMRCV